MDSQSVNDMFHFLRIKYYGDAAAALFVRFHPPKCKSTSTRIHTGSYHGSIIHVSAIGALHSVRNFNRADNTQNSNSALGAEIMGEKCRVRILHACMAYFKEQMFG